MFGYIRTVPSELRLREHECYRAYYCGLCRAMGKCTGQCSRLTLSYDFVFLAAVRCWLAGEKPEFRRFRCLVHPTRRRTAVSPSPQLAYCADASILLSYHKCLDDLADEHGFRKLRARLAMLGLHRGYHKARKRHPELDTAIRQSLVSLSAWEKRTDTHSADAPAEIFGELMRVVFTDGMDGANARIAGELGRNIGRWIYLVDAADDYEKDLKKHRYNPYLALFGDRMTGENREEIRNSLTAILCDAECAYLLMDRPACPELQEILSNILYLGMPRTAERVLFPTKHENDESADKGDQR